MSADLSADQETGLDADTAVDATDDFDEDSAEETSAISVEDSEIERATAEVDAAAAVVATCYAATVARQVASRHLAPTSRSASSPYSPAQVAWCQADPPRTIRQHIPRDRDSAWKNAAQRQVSGRDQSLRLEHRARFVIRAAALERGPHKKANRLVASETTL